MIKLTDIDGHEFWVNAERIYLVHRWEGKTVIVYDALVLGVEPNVEAKTDYVKETVADVITAIDMVRK
ncbi:MAG TPA: hypothetical protein VMT30_02580 [Candidatus Saccharimonadia bacterium]|nr:hypothetical protein [Candidatus Saccharimonadia bacterium]